MVFFCPFSLVFDKFNRPPQEQPKKKKKKGNPIMYGLIGVAAILVGGKLIFSLMNFLVLAVIAGVGAWWYFFKFRKDED